MQSLLFVACLLSALVATEAVFDGGLGLGLLALGALKLKGLALLSLSRRRGGGRHHKRSVLEAEELLLRASLEDAEDCAKKLVCALNTDALDKLEDSELSLATMFAKNNELDVSSVSVEFDLAALVGRKAGFQQCELIYSRCQYQPQQLVDVIRQPGLINFL